MCQSYVRPEPILHRPAFTTSHNASRATLESEYYESMLCVPMTAGSVIKIMSKPFGWVRTINPEFYHNINTDILFPRYLKLY